MALQYVIVQQPVKAAQLFCSITASVITLIQWAKLAAGLHALFLKDW